MEEYSVMEYSMEELRQTAEEVVPLLQEMFGEDVEIDVKEDLQVNRASLVICLQLPGAMVLPAVEVRDLMDLETVEEMADAAAVMIQNGLRQMKDLRPENLDTITPAYVLRHVVLEVVNQQSNAVLLDRCPHVKALDLAGVYCVPMKMDLPQQVMCLIRQGNMEDMGFTADQLYEAARKNTLRKLRVRVTRLDQMGARMDRFSQSYGHALSRADMGEDTWYFVDNWRHTSSASYLLIPEVLETLGERMGKNFYISVPTMDMMLVYPDSGDPALPRMFAQWLQDHPAGGRILSDRLYYYRRAKGLSLADI